MLDVHAPHETVHGWRDFLTHIATITIGLLIALGLEAGVEALHHRHLVREARENIRVEIRQNEEAAKQNIGYVQTDADSMKSNIEKARQLRANPHALDHGNMQFTFTWSSFNDSAWRSARDTGALSYMPTAEVQRYADTYNQQSIVNQEAVAIFTHQSELAAPFSMEEQVSDFRPEEIQTLMRESAVTELRLRTLKQIMEELEKEYADTLAKEP
jgi:hypothetical protein